MSRIIRLLVMFSVSLLVACGPAPESKADLQVEENKAIANRYYKEIWSQGKLDVIDEIFASDFVHHEPIVGEVRGPGGFKKYASILLTAFPDVQLTIEDQIAEGDKVVTRWTCTATHKGELIGIPPTGVQVTWTGIDILRIAGGKVVESWVIADDFSLFQQLGVVPPIGQSEE